MPLINYSENPTSFAQLPTKLEDCLGTARLAFRDLGMLAIEAFPHTPFEELKALDYGCGTGRSSLYLKRLGIKDITSVDIQESMLQEARKNDPEGHYLHIKNASVPFPSKTFDLVFSSFVIIEIDTQEAILEVFSEIYRLLKKGGVFMLITVSPELYNPNNLWVSINNQFPENHNPYSGSKVKMSDNNTLLFEDFFWTEQDLRELSQQAGFSEIKIHHPLGIPSDGVEWLCESEVAPYHHYLIRK
tara:strand:+ start:56294 stop:57028 length:735 start_codon:yes stop_codon:yes gene_type:complete